MTFQVNRAASQPMPLPLATKHMDPLVMAHETISDLAFLFTIWSTELTMVDPFPLGRESFFGYPMLPLSMSMEVWEVDLLIKFALPVLQIIDDLAGPSN